MYPCPLVRDSQMRYFLVLRALRRRDPPKGRMISPKEGSFIETKGLRPQTRGCAEADMEDDLILEIPPLPRNVAVILCGGIRKPSKAPPPARTGLTNAVFHHGELH